MAPAPQPAGRGDLRPIDGDTRCSPDTRGWVDELREACPLLASLPERVAEVIEANMHPVEFAEGAYLIRQGEPGDSLLVIRTGAVQIGAIDEHGRRHWIARTGRGQVIGEMSLLTGEPRTADVVAVRPVCAMVLPAAEFHRLARLHPEIAHVLTNIVARRLGGAEHDVLDGKTLGGWLIHGRLGKGGMSVVYQAEDAQGRRAALKMMSHRLVYEEDACRQFQREAEIVQQFDHPNIVRMYDRFAAFHTYFLALEYCDGRPLDEVLKTTGALTEGEARPIIGQLAAGLAYAHRAGVIHRDIKPSNVMVMRDGAVKLMDFGLARPVDEIPSRHESAVVGTPAYMAPEQLLGEPLTLAADLYALGAVMWELLTGRRLAGKATLQQLLQRHLDGTAPPVRERLPQVSDELAAAMDHCLACTPYERCVDLHALSQWAAPAPVGELLT